MPYVPRPATTAQCAHCNATFEKRHASRKYCSNSCNVQASYARTGYRSEGRPTRAELEQTLAKMTQMVELMTDRPAPAAKTAAKARFAEFAQKAHAEEAAAPTPAAKAAATKPKKKITKPTAHAPGGGDFDFAE